MSNKNNLYFDGIAAIQIQNGVVKMVMGNQEAPTGKETKDKPAPLNSDQVIAMPLNAFIYTIAVFINDSRNQEMIAKMQDAAGINQDKN